MTHSQGSDRLGATDPDLHARILGSEDAAEDRTMNIEEFRASLTASAPPAEISDLLTALWHEANDDWQRAHVIAQDATGADACWVHAYLHRKEGDLSNAGYWYRRAQRDVCEASLDAEWTQISEALLAP